MLAQSSAARQPHMQSGAAGLTAAAVSMPAASCCCILHARYACNSSPEHCKCIPRLLHVFALSCWRSSAMVRRAAAAYGNACEQFFGGSHLNSEPKSADPELSSRLTWHDFVYVTLALLYQLYHVATRPY